LQKPQRDLSYNLTAQFGVTYWAQTAVWVEPTLLDVNAMYPKEKVKVSNHVQKVEHIVNQRDY